jgi:hypothetical protein
VNQPRFPCAESEPTFIIGPRPGRKSLARLQDLQLTHVCSLLHDHETPQAIRILAEKIGCEWIWLPIAGGHLGTLRAVTAEQVGPDRLALADDMITNIAND